MALTARRHCSGSRGRHRYAGGKALGVNLAVGGPTPAKPRRDHICCDHDAGSKCHDDPAPHFRASTSYVSGQTTDHQIPSGRKHDEAPNRCLVHLPHVIIDNRA